MSSPTQNPVSHSDVLVLMVILARFEGALRGGEVDNHSIHRLAARCVKAGLLDAQAPHDRDEVAGVLDDIGQRLRYAIGEYPSDPTVKA